MPPSMACFFTAPLYAEFLRDFSGHVHCQSVASACLTAGETPQQQEGKCRDLP